MINDPNPIPANDAAKFIADQLGKGQDVEIAWFWSNKDGTKLRSGHWVTVTGIDYDTAGNGAINIIDPFGGVEISGNLYVGTAGGGNGGLIIGYTGGGAGNPADPDNPDDAGFGYITAVAAESVVPEPAYAGLAIFFALGIHREARTRLN